MLLFVLLWILGALIGLDAAKKRGFSQVAGLVAGFLLGPLAVLMYFVSEVG